MEGVPRPDQAALRLELGRRHTPLPLPLPLTLRFTLALLLKASRLREITQLRREARRTALEHHKLLQEHTKQNAVLKRRTEEVWAVQKRMRDGEAARRLRTAARTGTGAAAAGGGPREAWGGGDKGGAAAAARAETTSGMLAIGGGGLADAAADKLLEHELALRLKERSPNTNP